MSDKSLSSLLAEGKVKEAKVLLRSSVGQQERCSVWKKILEVRTSEEFHCSSLYWDTVDDCYGERTLRLSPDWRLRLPDCVDGQHCPQYGLSEEQTGKVCRVLTVFSFNNPDISYLPLLYPLTCLLLQAGLSEEETYSFLSMLVSPASPASGLNINYFTQTRSGWDILCFSLKPLAVKYVVSPGILESSKQFNFNLAAFQKESVAFIEKEFSSDSEEFFQSWPWWIFEDLSCGVRVRVVDCYLYEGHKVLFRAALALLKTFFKALKANAELYQTAKSSGLIPTFANYA